MIEQIRQQQKEQLYESKLRFFTNVTHELCTPLTLISGPCEIILSHSKPNDFVYKYANLIQRNVERLNSLIQELIEFRRLETDNKALLISAIQISEQTFTIADAFSFLAESRNIKYIIDIQNSICWNTDISCYTKIVNNLVSNAFKYTQDGGSVSVRLRAGATHLLFEVLNTGKGIKEEDIPKIFDRYRVLDDIEGQNKKGVSSRNGLGLAICHSMIRLLKGEIVVVSNLNEYTEFKVTLPWLEANIESITESFEMESYKPLFDSQISMNFDGIEFDKTKYTILIVDDDHEMLWFVSEIFIEKYNIIPCNDSREAIYYLKNQNINLIILDAIMPHIDGISLTKQIKDEKLLAHIPLILLSAQSDDEAKIRGIEAGAEMYITKPFNVEYLEKIVSRLVQRDENMIEYYKSALSSFHIDEGRIIHKEDKEFLEKMIKMIENNISNPNFSVDSLSLDLGISTRQFYRKLKVLTTKTPNEIIKEIRMKQVERLLATTNLSIDEIIYKTGFSNRGHFFKIFAQEYGMTPKNYRKQRVEAIKK